MFVSCISFDRTACRSNFKIIVISEWSMALCKGVYPLSLSWVNKSFSNKLSFWLLFVLLLLSLVVVVLLVRAWLAWTLLLRSSRLDKWSIFYIQLINSTGLFSCGGEHFDDHQRPRQSRDNELPREKILRLIEEGHYTRPIPN